MRVEKRKISGREKSEAAVRLLENLRERLFFGDASARRCAAFKLSWMQEDGLDILKEILFRGYVPITVRYAAAYGLRSMNGRMKKMALEAINEGLNCPNGAVREVCFHTLRLLEEKAAEKASPRPRVKAARFAIRDIPGRIARPRVVHTRPVVVHSRVRVH